MVAVLPAPAKSMMLRAVKGTADLHREHQEEKSIIKHSGEEVYTGLKSGKKEAREQTAFLVRLGKKVRCRETAGKSQD